MGGVYALTATYGGLDGKQFEMLAVVFRDDSPVAENANWNPAEVKDQSVSRHQNGMVKRQRVDKIDKHLLSKIKQNRIRCFVFWHMAKTLSLSESPL